MGLLMLTLVSLALNLIYILHWVSSAQSELKRILIKGVLGLAKSDLGGSYF